MKRIETLDEITSHYDFVFIDNSSLGTVDLKYCLQDSGKDLYEEDSKFMDCLISKIIGGLNFYFTPLVFCEIQERRKKLELNSPEIFLTEIMGRLVDWVCIKNRIVFLDKDQQKLYNQFYRIHSWFKNEYKLSEPDFDFLITGNVFSSMGFFTVLLSNDYGIFHAWENILSYRKADPRQFGFFVRGESTNFERVVRYFK